LAAVTHIDALQVAAVAGQIHHKPAAPLYQSVDPHILRMAVQIHDPQRDQVHIVTLGLKLKRPIGSIAVPLLIVAQNDAIGIDPKTDRLLPEQLPAIVLRRSLGDDW
jgi:hypothetical protein